MKKYESSTLNLKPNVIENEELKELFKAVFSDMAYYVSKTYGPFGENTGYQETNRILTTKDGWSVEQGIIYSNNVLANLIRTFIIEVSRSINVHAGDGTTTGVIAANEINNLIMDYIKDKKIHSKFLSSAIKYCVQEICNEINASSIKITDENMDKMIYRIAEVSMDWDKEYAGYIRDIYHNTHNPIIRVQDSGSEESFVEYRKGYDLSAKLLSEFKVNSIGVKEYTVKKPVILNFSYTISVSMFEAIMTAANYFYNVEHRELVIMAPDFEKDFRDNYNAACVRLIQMNKPVIPLVMVKYFAEFAIEREMINDFCFLTGSALISREYNEAADIIKEFSEIINQLPPNRDEFEEGTKGDNLFSEAMMQYQMTISDCSKEFGENIAKYIGTCDTMTVDDKMMVVDGFNGLENSEALANRKNVIQSEINKTFKKLTAKSMFTEEIKLKRIRLGKLALKMGVINVGGFGEYNLKAVKDALDDAINACSNAYTEGVVIGGGVTIPVTINTILDEIKSGELDPTDKGVDKDLAIDILKILKQSFINTWKVMLGNRYTDGYYYPTDDKETPLSLDDIINLCITEKMPWNLITEQFDKSIIHPAKVETEVLKGCLHLILVTTQTNQLLYNGYEGIDKELSDMRLKEVEVK